ncbi:hypothetical protein H2200_005873 [Cladophialophora chaetospira]|uniref:Uncharacterized protein n=1 Tax=Cladophialophora chaetospira TaxID=386627 RepID=A0AA38XA27_9EURO|nr:hypothetical protein H2200_005873 [Cladophialophora chaetospira]
MLGFSRLASILLYESIQPRASSQLAGERKKIVISSSKWKALWRCGPHLLPIAGSITILSLSLNGIYIGADFASETLTLMGFQIAAKIHEIFIVASLSVIVFHAVRHEMLCGDGLPLGLIGSGFNFGGFDFFFTKEFRGGLLNAVTPGHRLRKTGFVILVLLAGVIAALAGPSSATLIVPSSQTWKAGGTHFYLNGSSETFWPSDVSSEASSLQNMCHGSNSTELAICPAAGYLSILEHWGRMNYTNFYTYDVPAYAKRLSGSRFYWPVYSPASPIPPRYALGGARNTTSFSPGSATYYVQPHAAVATLAQRLANKWWRALQLRMKVSDRQVDDRKIGIEAPSAITTIRCGSPQNLPASSDSVHFPALDGRFDYATGMNFNVTTLNTSGVNHVRFQWVHLPDVFGSISIGAVLESAWNVNKTSRVVIGCSAQAGWVPTSVYSDEYSFWTGWYPWDIQFGGRTPSWIVTSAGQAQSATNGRVAFNDDWLSLLTPTLTDMELGPKAWVPSTIEHIITASGLAKDLHSQGGVSSAEAWVEDGQLGISRTILLESIISSVITDGLSRSGVYRVFDMKGPVQEWPLALFDPHPDFNERIVHGHEALQVPVDLDADITTLRIKMQITGFALKRSLAGALAMVVLLAHTILASGHIILVMAKGQSSDSWDSISELVALAQNSRPSYIALANTAAGISETRTYGRLAKIRAKPTIERAGGDHVELVFDAPHNDETELLCSDCKHGIRGHPKVVNPEAKDNAGDEVQHVEAHLSQELREDNIEPKPRQQWTWPRHATDGLSRDQTSLGHASHLRQSIPARSRSGSRETLITQRNSPARRASGDTVRVDHEYR